MTNVVSSMLKPDQPFKELGCPSCNLLSLNHLALQQKINANFIFHAIKNYKKSPTDRKTITFIKNKFQGLKILWLEFQRRDNQIRRYYNCKEDQHEYFQQELFSLVKEKYMLARVLMNRDRKKLLLHTTFETGNI
ncbi:uncharacterized protein LOC132798997 [Drosophila nasuta]|uniref:Uncharacterized protein LOC117565784 n=1 Tax=Drosophila albomicans TaxID=7291 RepID=A0A6P8WB98_DROAB|nr:uncharacterized protein LOC117565784 [Drosophila albomicans]XP_060667076.1 uncharacterized protein LOC132798997 [Drosophila nasuta]